MKKLVLMLIAALSVALTGCSAFDSEPIEPKIIGTTFLQEEKGLIFAEFDSVRYAPTIVYTGEKVGRDGMDGKVKPVAGMQVTAFTSSIHPEPVFFVGQATVKQIEKYYQHSRVDEIVVVIFFILFCICITGICQPAQKKVDEVNADV